MRSELLAALVLPLLLSAAVGQVLPSTYDKQLIWTEVNGLPTSLDFDDQGRLLLLTAQGYVRVLQDLDGDRIIDVSSDFWSGQGIAPNAVGLMWFQGKVWISHQGTISTIEDLDGDLVGDVKVDLVTGLPHGYHQNNDLFHDGSWVYFGLGSISDHSADPDPRSCTVMRMQPDGSNLTIYATGLRNVFDGAVHPVRGDVLVADNGPNFVPGNPNPPDEIDVLQEGGDYGHPADWGVPPPGSNSLVPLLELPPHLGPTGLDLDSGAALSGYRHQMILAGFGNPASASGGLLRIPLVYGTNAMAPPASWIELFDLQIPNPIDCVFGPDRALYVLGYYTGDVLRIAQSSPAWVVIEGQSSLGVPCTVALEAPDHPGRDGWVLASDALATSPLSLGPGLDFLIDLQSPVTAMALMPMNGIFDLPVAGMLDGNGRITGTITIPNVPLLAGFGLKLQGLVTDRPTALVMAVSPVVDFLVLPAF